MQQLIAQFDARPTANTESRTYVVWELDNGDFYVSRSNGALLTTQAKHAIFTELRAALAFAAEEVHITLEGFA